MRLSDEAVCIWYFWFKNFNDLYKYPCNLSKTILLLLSPAIQIRVELDWFSEPSSHSVNQTSSECRCVVKYSESTILRSIVCGSTEIWKKENWNNHLFNLHPEKYTEGYPVKSTLIFWPDFFLSYKYDTQLFSRCPPENNLGRFYRVDFTGYRLNGRVYVLILFCWICFDFSKRHQNSFTFCILF